MSIAHVHDAHITHTTSYLIWLFGPAPNGTNNRLAATRTSDPRESAPRACSSEPFEIALAGARVPTIARIGPVFKLGPPTRATNNSVWVSMQQDTNQQQSNHNRSFAPKDMVNASRDGIEPPPAFSGPRSLAHYTNGHQQAFGYKHSNIGVIPNPLFLLAFSVRGACSEN
jgi:hypothetical protein